MLCQNRRFVSILASLALAAMVFGAYPARALAYSPSNPGYTWDEIMLLARLVHAEAAGEPYMGKVAVAAVVLNRVKSPLFPDTIWEVIYEPWQFSSVGNWMFNSYPSQECFNAVMDALAGVDPTNGALFYFNYHMVTNSWLWSRPFAAVIGNHRFSY